MQDSDVFFLTNGNKTLSGIDETCCPAELNIPYGVVKIDAHALADCPAKSIILPDTVKEICFEAFSGSDALEYVRMPNNPEKLEPAIFRGCLSLQKVDMGDTSPNFSEGMFELCPSLKEIQFRSGMTEIPRNAFSECTSIESLVIPEGIAVIKSGAVAYCKNLSTLVLPSTLKIIEDDAFHGCTNLAHIRINGQNPVFFVDEDTGCLFENREDGDITLIKVPSNAIEIRVPKKVSHCHGEAFQGCDALERVYVDCNIVDHPLFVALKTEIVNAEIIDETQIVQEKPKAKKAAKPKKEKIEKPAKEKAEKTPKAKTEKTPKEKKTAKPKKPRAPKKEKKQEEEFMIEETSAEETVALGVAENIEAEQAVDENLDLDMTIEESVEEAPIDGFEIDFVEQEEAIAEQGESTEELEIEIEPEEVVPEEAEVDIEVAPEEVEQETEPEPEQTTEEAETEYEIIEPDTPEPKEPNTEALVVEAPQEESMVESDAEKLAESLVTPSADDNENFDTYVEEPQVEDPLEQEIVETAVDEPIVEENESAVSNDDMIASILEQNIATNETPEEEEELKGITITIDELDAAMMRGIQEEDDKHYEIPEGFFPTGSNAEEEPMDMPPPEPRFVNGLMSVSAACEIIDERTLYPERPENELSTAAPNELEDITTLVVVTEEVTSDNAISETLKNFCVELARKHNLIRIYFFGAVGLDNDELLFGFGKFALYRNIIYAPKASDFDSLSAEIKSFAEIAELDGTVIHTTSETLELEKPFKIFVQDADDAGTAKTAVEPQAQKTKKPQPKRKKLNGKGLLQKAQQALENL